MHQTYKKNLMIAVPETGQESSPRYLPGSFLPTYPIKQRIHTDHSVLSTNDHLSTSANELEITSYSALHAASPRKRPQSPSHSFLPCHPPNNEFAVLQRILKNQNQNLKMQNELLLSEAHRLRKSNHKYKDQCRKSALQLQEVRLQCEAQKRRADEMKEIIMSRLAQLEGKITQGGMDNLGLQCGNILDALTLSESSLK